MVFFEFGSKNNLDLSSPASLALCVGLILGLYLFALAIRNRVYFVHVTRYINEQRGLFLSYTPLGFDNKSGMYTNHTQPPHFNWRSSQTWFTYIIATLNSILAGALIYVFIGSTENRWHLVTLCALVTFVVPLFIGITYLNSREKKSASKSVFGGE